jgi:subtilase family serine protease
MQRLVRRIPVAPIVFVSLGLAVGLSACSSGPAAPSSDEPVARSVAAVTAGGAGLDTLHVKGVRLAPGKAGAAPTDALCRSAVGFPCYSPEEIQTAYGLSSLLADGFDGKGQTIVIVDSYGSPTIAADLAQFDADYGLPAPPSFQVLSPLGTVAWDPTNADMVSWAMETSLDVQWAHAMAPGASIVLLTSPVDETEGTAGLPEFAKLLTYALDHRLGQVISQSWAATENTLMDADGQAVVAEMEAIYKRAAAEHVTVFASAGDYGASNAATDVDGNLTFFSFPTVNYPASSRYVTAVGGTSLTADTSGNYGSETVWNDSAEGGGAGGGGVSQLFAEPSWQKTLPAGVQGQLARHRGIPDVSYNGDPLTSILIYMSMPGIYPGYYFIGGTSEGSPQWAGIAADFDQVAGRPLGALNSKLYALGALRLLPSVLHDVTVGNTSYNGVTGDSATPGWDLASGWGTPNLGQLGALLATMPDDDGDE